LGLVSRKLSFALKIRVCFLKGQDLSCMRSLGQSMLCQNLSSNTLFKHQSTGFRQRYEPYGSYQGRESGAPDATLIDFGRIILPR